MGLMWAWIAGEYRRPMGISKQLNRVRRQLVRTSCLAAAACLLAGGLFLISSITHLPDQQSTFLGQIWGASDADAGRRRNRKDREDWDPPTPTVKVTPPTKPNSQPTAKVEKKDDDDDDGAPAKKNDKARPAAAAADTDDIPDVPSTLQGVLSKWLAPTKPLIATPTQAIPSNQAVPANKVTTGATSATRGVPTQGAATQSPLSQAARSSTTQGWAAQTTATQTTTTQSAATQATAAQGAAMQTATTQGASLPNKNAPNKKVRNRNRDRDRDEEEAREAVETAAKAAAASAAATAASSAQAKSGDTAKSADGSAARRSSPGDLSLRVPLVNQAHILARNLTAQTLKNATDLGLKVKGSRSIDVLGTTVTQLVVPPHLDIAQARAALQQIAPDSALSFNQQYRLYPQAKGESSQVSQEPARSTGGCTPDRCYGARAIGWQGDLGVCARDLKIGVIDTGIDGSHPALSHDSGRISYGVIGPEKRAPGNDLHGTGVLALLAGDPRSSTPGLVPRAKFFVADIFFADEKGLPVSTTMHLLEALDWMERMQVQIINLSLSGPSDDLVKAAIAKMSRTRTVDGASRPGTIFIAAAGNGGPGAPPSYPAAYSEVVAVTAVSKDLRSYRRANQGDYIDIAAPGVDIWTALPDGRQGFQTGTSFATPYVTAVVASVYRNLPRTRTKTAVLQHLPVQDLGAPGPDRIYGRGLVNAPASCDPDKTPVVARRVPAVVPTTKVSAN